MCKKFMYLFVVACVLYLAASASADLKGWWKFDEGTGTTCSDSSGNGKTATLTNMDAGTDWVSGKVGPYALDFDGSDDYVAVPAMGITTVPASLACWIKRDGDQADWSGIMFRQEGGIWFGLNFRDNNDLGYHWNASYWQWGSGITVPDNTWVFVALSIASDRGTVYMVNGGSTSSNYQAMSTWAEDWTGVLAIGRAGFYAGRCTNGVIDNPRIFNHALSQAEVQSLVSSDLYGQGKATTPIPGSGSIVKIEPGVVLKWTKGGFVQQTNEHMVYLGTTFADVNTATTASAAYKGVRDVNNYTTSGLVENTTYYWRIDEVNTANGSSPWKGDVWNFTPKKTKYLRCFLLGGQSNATGCADAASIPSPYNAIQYGVKIYITGQSGWSPGWNPLQPNMGAAWGAFGPEVSFGYDMDDMIDDTNVAIIKTTYGGSGLHDRWLARSGDLYYLMLDTVDASLAALSGEYQPMISGFIWMQGENDASYSQAVANAYNQNLRNMISAFREDIPATNMPFVIGQIANDYPWAWGTIVQAAQQNVGDTYAYCDWFYTDDLGMNGDNVHYNTSGQITLGQRFADAMVKMVPRDFRWKFDEGTGTIAANSGSFSPAGACSGTLTNMDAADWVSGKVGSYALDFDGTNDYVALPSLGLYTNEMTVSAWIKRDGTQTNYAGIVACSGCGLLIKNGNMLANSWSSLYTDWESMVVVPDNEWVMAVLQSSEWSGRLYLCKDGSIIDSAAQIVGHNPEEWGSSLRIGSNGNAYFKGRIDDVRIYNRVLSEAEIADLAGEYNVGCAGSPIPWSTRNVASTSPTLKWTKGDYTQTTNEHQVYLGASYAEVDSATTASSCYKGVRDVNNYPASSLVEGETYYWRIDELNTSNPSSPWKGPVWSFTVTMDVKADTWVATDGYNRSMPDYAQCGGPKSGRFSGIFYFLWLDQHSTGGPYDITDILDANPYNPAWGPAGTYHHWCEPEIGYYTSMDDWAMRRHAQQLVDAGIDTVVFDATNAWVYEWVVTKLCKTWRQIRNEGGRTPQICWITNTNSIGVVNSLYVTFYKPGLYKELWFYWDGKPLVLAELSGHSSEIASFFTIRRCWAWTNGQYIWNWLEHYPQDYGWHESSGVAEEVSACMAQHPVTNIGRSFSGGSQPYHDPLYALTGLEEQGRCYNEQWNRALALNPEFLYITGWNEWVASRVISNGTYSMHGELVPSGGSVFPDCYNREYSRDGEPLKGYYTDNYYYQTIIGQRKFKGVRSPDSPSGTTTITIDGSFGDWASVAPEFRDTMYDTTNRNEVGWNNYATLVNTTGRNDIYKAWVARDSTNVYFRVRCTSDITARTDPNWMVLFIDSDKNHSTGWEGYDYVVNLCTVGSSTTTLKSNSGGTWTWNTVRSDIAWAKNGKDLELAIPRTSLGFAGGEASIDFYFHWHDNLKVNGLDDMFVNGDSAPNRRFNYRYTGPGSDSTPPSPDPMTFETNPYALGPFDTSMVATLATDSYPANVEYYFDETSGNAGGSDSGWTTNRTYGDSALAAATTYSYRVKARDESPNWNETQWSSTLSVRTGDTPPLSYSYANGSYYSGSVSDMSTDNDVYFVSKSKTSGTTRYMTVAFDFRNIPISTPSAIVIRATNKASTSGVTQKLKLWNFSTSTYDQKDSTTIGTTEVTREFTVTSGASNYISGGVVYPLQDCSKTLTTFYIYHELLWVTVRP